MGGYQERGREVEPFQPRDIIVLDGELHANDSGLYFSRVHTLIYSLWENQRDTQQLRTDSMTVTKTKGLKGEKRKIVTINAQTKDEEQQIVGLTKTFRDGVLEWIKDPKGLQNPPFDVFYNRYIQPRMPKPTAS